MKISSAALAIILRLSFYGVATADEAKPEVLLNALHQVQDRLAHGDLTAVGAQAELLLRLPSALAKASAKPRNHDQWEETTIGYALSGGFSNQVNDLLAKIPADSQIFALGKAVSAYSNGDMGSAREQFQSLDTSILSPDILPYFNFASGTANLQMNKSQSITNFEHTLLGAPGTLLEEVALRRLLYVSLMESDKVKFRRSANLYFRRYLDSPFAKELINSYLEGAFLFFENEEILQDITLICSLPSDQKRFAIVNFSYRALVNGNIDLVRRIFQIYDIGECGKDKSNFSQMDFYRFISDPKTFEDKESVNEIHFWQKTNMNNNNLIMFKNIEPILKEIFQPVQIFSDYIPNNKSDVSLKKDLFRKPDFVLLDSMLSYIVTSGNIKQTDAVNIFSNSYLDSWIDSKITDYSFEFGKLDKISGE